MAAGPGLIGRLRAAALGAALWAGGAAGAALGQDPVQRDTAVEVLPDSIRRVFQDTTPPPAQRYPARLLPLRGPAHEVFACDRACVHASTAFSLLELLLERVPGMTGLRAGFFAGPHHALDGPFGPGFTRLFIDGREILPLERRQTDLRRLSLNYVERVRVFRGAGGLIIDVDLIRHDAVRAYSRIAGGTGDPQAQLLDGAFANGLGRSINIEGSFELLDVNAGGDENDRFGALGRLSWMPGSNRFGLQLEFRTASVDRAAADTADVRRRELVLRARGDLGSAVQLEAFGSMSDWREEVPGLEEGEGPRRGVDAVGLRLSAAPGPAAVSGAIRFAGGPAAASWLAELAAWLPVGPVALEAGAELASWNDFSTRSLRGGLVFSDTLLLPVTVRGFAASGDRGVGFPADASADSVGFDALAASADLGIGPFTLSGRYAVDRLDRAIPFGELEGATALDPGEVEVTSWEVGLEGPLIPLGGILPGLDPIRVRAWWRRNRSEGADALFVPDMLARGELALHDTFFDGNLELWLSGFLERRGQRLVPVDDAPDPAVLAADTWPGGQFMFKIGDFRFFWRFTNPSGLVVTDIPGADFPPRVNVFGIRWEFFN